ncbi:hypothetical protein PI124_g17057 [Phytophthora idaei]|nr:hypothetical protein PI126_g11020 [Phytophthora idaei]KAG3237969.1 hypothetical protein PI124_g17057 [Phytophthora idaei]
MVMLSSGETSAPCGQGCQLRRGEDADNYDDRGIQWTTTETTDKILPSTHQYAAVACGEHMADSVWRSTASAQPFSTSRTVSECDESGGMTSIDGDQVEVRRDDEPSLLEGRYEQDRKRRREVLQ